YNDWPGLVAVGEETRCVGDVIAAVAADDEPTARAAAAAVRVEYEVLEAVLDPEVSIAAGAPRVNPTHDNVLGRSRILRGDAEAALRASAHVVKGRWTTQRIEHLFLEPECALAEPLSDGRLKLYTQGQGIFDDRRQVASFLGVPVETIEVELVPNGGAFGGKEDMSVQAQTALLAHLTGRPVRVHLTREESVRIHPKRHPITMDYEVGCDAEGHLTVVKAKMIGDSGAYASVGAKVLERAAGHSTGPYRVPNVDVEAIAAYTNNPPCGAMRGFGANQASFAIEGCVDMLAEEVGIDGWTMRDRNIVEVGDVTATGQILEAAVGLRATLEAVKDRYYEAKKAGKAVGVACGLKNTGIGNGVAEWGKCRLVVEEDGTVSLYNGYTEMGQGLLTVLSQFAAEVTGLDTRVFRPKVDSTFALDCGQTTGSRATFFGGIAAVSAAKRLREDLERGKTLGELVGQVYAADEVIDDTTALGADVPKIKTHTSYGWATQVCILDAEGRVERMIAAHDVGRAVNPDLCEGQIEGAVHMGLGYALTEELPTEDGMPVTFKMRDIGVLRARDTPPCEVILVEAPEPEGPFGVKGVGEIGLVPTAGAVAIALGEEDREEMHRRLHYACRQLDLSREERDVATSRILALPPAGISCALVENDADSNMREAAFLAEMRDQLGALGVEWRLVIVDPLSRFAGLDAESSNAAATRFVQALETLTQLPGRPAVLCAHHTTKNSRRDGRNDQTTVRGASALVDGARWVASLTNVADTTEHARFAIHKSNYAGRPDPLLLTREWGGALRRATLAEEAELDDGS
ncbi:MAG: molybdopterin-dependent oxidoreductase, partial [Myxococcales bacterium]|nr:molybdopterin-dependent oxidoreductase [Myxococcales bacterium]